MNADLYDFRFKMTRCTSRTLSYFKLKIVLRGLHIDDLVVEDDAHKPIKDGGPLFGKR